MTQVQVPIRCEESRRQFEIVFEDLSGNWLATDIENVSQSADGSEGNGGLEHIEGEFGVAPGFEGCPDCGQTSFFKCGYCESLACWDGTTEEVVCPWCQETSTLETGIESLEGHTDSGDDTQTGYLSRQ